MTDLQNVELNVNACISKINKMYKVIGLSLVRFEENHLINAFGTVSGIMASLGTFKKMHEGESDVYRYNVVDEGIIDVFAAELQQALDSITYLYGQKYGVTI
jgi:hypothetical protein